MFIPYDDVFQESQSYSTKSIQQFFNGVPDKWWMRIPMGCGCRIILFPKFLPRYLTKQQIIDKMLSSGFKELGEHEYLLENAWNNQGNEQAIPKRAGPPLWQIMVHT